MSYNNNYAGGGGGGGNRDSEIYVVDNYHQNSSSSRIGRNHTPSPTIPYNNHPHSHHQQQQQNYNSSSRPPSAAPTNNSVGTVITTTSERKKRNAGVNIETMSAPNPFCPNSRGVCCLLLLVNLGLILVTLGFSVVLQLFQPEFVWYCGILFLIVGFIALIASLIFCVSICRENDAANIADNNEDGRNLYWTHHWQKRIEI